MNKLTRTCVVLLVAGIIYGSAGVVAAEDAPPVYPTAVFAFEERGSGVKGYGGKAADILFATLVVKPDLYLVDRQDLKKTMDEHELNLSGAVRQDQAVQISQLTGAKILVTGSVIEIDKTIYLVAKIIGTETSRVLGESVKGKTSSDFGAMAEELGAKIAETIRKEAGKLVAKEIKMEDRIAALKEKVGTGEKPTLSISIEERHVGQAVIDPAAETEFTLFSKAAGFSVLDKTANMKKVDIMIIGEGFSEFAMRRGNLVSVKARLEIKAVDMDSDKVIAIDRQTAVVVDLTEQIAGKAALQQAAAAIAERMLPKLAQ